MVISVLLLFLVLGGRLLEVVLEVSLELGIEEVVGCQFFILVAGEEGLDGQLLVEAQVGQSVDSCLLLLGDLDVVARWLGRSTRIIF